MHRSPSYKQSMQASCDLSSSLCFVDMFTERVSEKGNKVVPLRPSVCSNSYLFESSNPDPNIDFSHKLKPHFAIAQTAVQVTSGVVLMFCILPVCVHCICVLPLSGVKR